MDASHASAGQHGLMRGTSDARWRLRDVAADGKHAARRLPARRAAAGRGAAAGPL